MFSRWFPWSTACHWPIIRFFWKRFEEKNKRCTSFTCHNQVLIQWIAVQIFYSTKSSFGIEFYLFRSDSKQLKLEKSDKRQMKSIQCIWNVLKYVNVVKTWIKHQKSIRIIRKTISSISAHPFSLPHCMKLNSVNHFPYLRYYLTVFGFLSKNKKREKKMK